MTPSPDPTVLWLPASTWDVIGRIVQIAAILLGGLWAYLAFVRGRLRFPHASLQHSITHCTLDDGRRLLRVGTTISNSGGVILRLVSGTFQVNRVLPLPDTVSSALETPQGPVAEGDLEIEWPPVHRGYRKHDWSEEKRPEIEPGESDVLVCDFIVPADLTTVEVYTYLKNSKKGRWRWRPWRWRRGRRELGWRLATLYDLDETGAHRSEKDVEADDRGVRSAMSDSQQPPSPDRSDPREHEEYQQPPRRTETPSEPEMRRKQQSPRRDPDERQQPPRTDPRDPGEQQPSQPPPPSPPPPEPPPEKED